MIPLLSTCMQETYFFVTRPGQGVFYNEIETRYVCSGANSSYCMYVFTFILLQYLFIMIALYCRVRLSKRRGKSAKSAMNSKLVVKHRELTEEEVVAQVGDINIYCGITVTVVTFKSYSAFRSPKYVRLSVHISKTAFTLLIITYFFLCT